LEWDGSSIISLFEDLWYRSPYGAVNQNLHHPGSFSISGLPNEDPPFSPAVFEDIDENGMVEILLSGGIPSGSEARYYGPWRVETITLSWNGYSYVVSGWQPDVPRYRFQAVQDGDVFTRWNQYDQALTAYQQVISDESLDDWSVARQAYEQKYVFNPYFEGTPPQKPAPDPAEYPNLAAYASFRILLLHALQDHLPEAQISYEALLTKFPPETEGSIYSDLAQLFWEEYQVSQDKSSACAVVVQKVSQDPFPYLRYLGNGAADAEHPDADIFGHWSLTYTPEDLCPIEP
jgi:hypothetical protein